MTTEAPTPVVPPVRWGFLGAGFIASRALIPASRAVDTAELVAVAARSAARAKQLAPEARAFDDYAALIDDPDVEAVYISLTNDVHKSWTVRALEAGKHVLCEKPLGMDAVEVRAMIDAADSADRLLVEAAWNRWHPRTASTIALLRSGRFGTPRTIEAAFEFRGVAEGNFRWIPEFGGGALYDLGAYALAAPLWATDWAPLEDVTATARITESGVDAATTAHLVLGGVSADARMSIDDDDEQWFVLRTERAALRLSAPVFTSWHEKSTLTVTTDDGSDDYFEEFAPVDPYALMLDNVSRAARGDPSAWVLPLTQSLRMAETLDAVRAASRS